MSDPTLSLLVDHHDTSEIMDLEEVSLGRPPAEGDAGSGSNVVGRDQDRAKLEPLTPDEENEIRDRFFLPRLPRPGHPPSYRETFDALAAALQGRKKVFNPAWVSELPDFRRCCLRCGAKGRDFHPSRACNLAVVCDYCCSDSHTLLVCPVLMQVCVSCGCRGHQSGTQCPTNIDSYRGALERFEEHADRHAIAVRRHTQPFLGFYFFEVVWAVHHKFDLSYQELIKLPPPEALFKVRVADHPRLLIQKINGAREEGRKKREREGSSSSLEARLAAKDEELEMLRKKLRRAEEAGLCD